jgi:hypothetical protein
MCITLKIMVYNTAMRTTITMDEETAVIATQYARANGLSLSKAISELIQRAAHPPTRIKHVDGFPVLDLPKPKEPLTTERVKELEEEW